MNDFFDISKTFFSKIASGEIEIYNEFSLQHEFGVFLRSITNPSYRIQFERNISFFGIKPSGFVKKEIDLSIFSSDRSKKFAIEFKNPCNGQYPEQMFSACKDICFLEQLRRNGFSRCWFIMLANDRLFYSNGNKNGIYRYFRAQAPINGIIQKPTGSKYEEVQISGYHTIMWNDLVKIGKFAIVEI